MAALQAKIGKGEEATASRAEARRIVAEIGESLRAVDMRDAFLRQPQVKVLNAAEMPRDGR